MNILLSHPRSGNTWLRYMVSEASRMMCMDGRLLNSIQGDLGARALPSGRTEKGSPKYPLNFETLPLMLCKTHDLSAAGSNFLHPFGAHFVETFNAGQVRLIFLLRNYRGAVLDQHNGSLPFYLKILKQYDKYEGPKLLIKYEDLVSFPEECLKRALEFMGFLDGPRYDDFISSLEDHRARSLHLYTTQQGNFSHTKGALQKDPSNPALDSQAIALGGDLFNEYLKSFRE